MHADLFFNIGTPLAAAIFVTGLAGIYINYASDFQRQEFRRRNGDITVWCGKKPEYIEGGCVRMDGTCAHRFIVYVFGLHWSGLRAVVS